MALSIIVIILFISLFVARKLCVAVTVEGSSMMPTMLPKDTAIILKIRSPRFLKRGRIIFGVAPTLVDGKIVQRESSGLTKMIIKRIIGEPGDEVKIHTNDIPDHIRRRCNIVCNEEGYYFWKIPPGHVFLLGDDIQNSTDSRQWGAYPHKLIYGIVVKIIRNR